MQLQVFFMTLKPPAAVRAAGYFFAVLRRRDSTFRHRSVSSQRATVSGRFGAYDANLLSFAKWTTTVPVITR